jgi:hypothetical protein
VGWFFGFKLHLVVNDRGELLSLRLTPGNTDDRRPAPELVKGLFGKLFGDKGYVSGPLFEALYGDGVQLVTKLTKKMKNRLIPLLDKIMPRKRAASPAWCATPRARSCPARPSPHATSAPASSARP